MDDLSDRDGEKSPRSVIVPDELVDTLAQLVALAVPGVRTIGIDAAGTLTGDPTGAVALLRYFPYDRYHGAFGADRVAALLAEVPTLRLIQSHSAGVDGLLSPRLVASHCALCNAAPIHSGPMAEVVLALMLAVAKRIPFHVRNQATHTWQRIAKDELRGSTVGIVGFGRIGATVAQLCAAFGMRVLGLRRTAMQAPPPGVEPVTGPAGLDALLAEADWIELTVPFTAASRSLIGGPQLARMKRSACLINVARGDVVDEQALREHLREGRLAYACLDTFHQEPLPSTDPRWDMPNVLVTPHNSASSPPGADGVIGVMAVKTAPADGYTILLASNSSLTVNPIVIKGLPYDPLQDLKPISGLTRGMTIFMVAADSKLRTFTDLVTAMKQAREPLTVGTYSTGYRLAIEWFAELAGVKFTNVPYKGAAAMFGDVIANRLDWAVTDLVGAGELLRAGKLRAIAVSGDLRYDEFPDVPTVRESGLAAYVNYTWSSLSVRAETPDDITNRLADALQKVLTLPATQEFLKRAKVELMPLPPAAMRKFQMDEGARLRRTADAAEIKPE